MFLNFKSQETSNERCILRSLIYGHIEIDILTDFVIDNIVGTDGPPEN